MTIHFSFSIYTVMRNFLPNGFEPQHREQSIPSAVYRYRWLTSFGAMAKGLFRQMTEPERFTAFSTTAVFLCQPT